MLVRKQKNRWESGLIGRIRIALALQSHSLMIAMRPAITVGRAVGKPTSCVNHYTRVRCRYVEPPA